MKLNLKLHFTNFLVKYLAGLAEIILKVLKCFAFRLQVYETWFGRVIASLALHYCRLCYYVVIIKKKNITLRFNGELTNLPK